MQWFSGSIPEAVNEAKSNNKLFLVYIEGTDDLSKSMTNTYNDTTIAQKLSTGNVVALKLAANSVPFIQFCAIYPVLIIPSSYFIGVNGAPIEIVTGSLIPTEFASKIDSIFEIHEKVAVKKTPIASPQPSSSRETTPTAPPEETPTAPPEKNIADSNQPSTSQCSNDSEKDKDLPLDDRVERAKQLLEVKRQMKEQEEKEKEKNQELERRSVGKALQKIKKDQNDKGLEEWAKTMAKDKEEERLARQKVLDMIAQDRAERAARFQQHKDIELEEKDKLSKIREEQERAAKSAAFNSNEAHIQFRLPDGSSTNHVFPADATLNDAKKFVTKEVRPPFSYFSLCTTFPRRHFTAANYSESLRDLQLAPSAVLLILPDQTVSGVYSGGNFLTNIFWMLMSPITSVWRLITSFFSSTPRNNEEASPPPSAEPSTSQETERNNSQTGARQRNNRFSKREGNIYRINNQSDDDENNTWNGNSTQQM